MPAAVLCCLLTFAGPAGPPGEVVAEAGGESITRGRANLLLALRGVPEPRRAAAWEGTVAELTDRARMRAFLAKRRATPDETELDAAAAALTGQLGDEPAAVLKELGVTAADVRAEAALPLAWEVQARRLITPDSLREHFESNRRRFDDTALTLAQIFKPGDATAELAALKTKIEAGELTFAEAAKRYSKAPTAGGGGVIGPVRAGDGRVPPEVSEVAFGLKDGAVGGPVRSAVGTHLVTVLGVAEPGELVLEDVVGRVRRDLKRELWNEQLARLR